MNLLFDDFFEDVFDDFFDVFFDNFFDDLHFKSGRLWIYFVGFVLFQPVSMVDFAIQVLSGIPIIF